MSVTGNAEEKLTVGSVTAELEAMETHYRGRKKKLRALLAVLKEEAAELKAELKD